MESSIESYIPVSASTKYVQCFPFSKEQGHDYQAKDNNHEASDRIDLTKV